MLILDIILFLSLFTGHAGGFQLLCVIKRRTKDSYQ